MVSAEECRRLLTVGALTKSDADISGIGVILAFLISAYVSFIAVLGAYVSGMVEQELLTPVDTGVLRIRSRTKRHPRLYSALQQTVLVLSDQQIVTGIAIMSAGFVGLRRGDINVYHYQVVLYLAWLSSSVHLSALTLLRPFLNTRPGVRAWRLCGMIVLFIMLIIGLIPTVSNDWGIVNFSDPNNVSVGETQSTGWGVPAACFWGKTYGDGVNNDAPIGYLLLIVSYAWKIGDMFEVTRNCYGSKVRRLRVLAVSFSRATQPRLCTSIKLRLKPLPAASRRPLEMSRLCQIMPIRIARITRSPSCVRDKGLGTSIGMASQE